MSVSKLFLSKLAVTKLSFTKIRPSLKAGSVRGPSGREVGHRGGQVTANRGQAVAATDAYLRISGQRLPKIHVTDAIGQDDIFCLLNN